MIMFTMNIGYMKRHPKACTHHVTECKCIWPYFQAIPISVLNCEVIYSLSNHGQCIGKQESKTRAKTLKTCRKGQMLSFFLPLSPK